MGRVRKALKDKSTNLIVKLDNKLIFELCEKFDIEYDPEAVVFDREILNQINSNILLILQDYLKKGC